jgi:hypothetical protein
MVLPELVETHCFKFNPNAVVVSVKYALRTDGILDSLIIEPSFPY